MIEGTENNSKFHYVMGLLLFIAGLLILVIFVSLRSRTDSTSTSAEILNKAPSTDSVVIAPSPVTFSESTDTSVTVSGSYTDLNGCDEVDPNGSVVARLYRSAVAGASSCAANDLNCYVNAGCTLSNCSGGGASDITGDYSCAFTVKYYADATDSNDGVGNYSAQTWVAFVTTTDKATAGDPNGTTGTNSANVEVNLLTAIDVGSSIAYGNLNLGDTSGIKTLVITDTGNDADVDVQNSGTHLNCTTGTMMVGQQKYSGVSSFAYADGTALSSAATDFQLNLNKQQDSNASQSSTYWRLLVPASPTSSLKGTCTGTNTITAAHSL